MYLFNIPTNSVGVEDETYSQLCDIIKMITTSTAHVNGLRRLFFFNEPRKTICWCALQWCAIHFSKDTFLAIYYYASYGTFQCITYYIYIKCV